MWIIKNQIKMSSLNGSRVNMARTKTFNILCRIPAVQTKQLIERLSVTALWCLELSSTEDSTVKYLLIQGWFGSLITHFDDQINFSERVFMFLSIRDGKPGCVCLYWSLHQLGVQHRIFFVIILLLFSF